MAWTPAVFPVGGGSGSVDPVEPPSPTSEQVGSGVGLSAKTFSAFSDTGGRIASYTAVNTQASGSCTWSGSGLGPYTPSDSDGDAGTLSLNALDSSGDVVATAVHSYERDAAPSGASWSTVADVDFTTDITDVTLTIDGGDTTLYEADGTTAKATVYALTRFGNPSTESAAITAADGGFKIRCGGSSDAILGGVKVDTDALGIDFDDPTVAVAVYAVVTGYTLPQNDDSVAVGIGPVEDVRVGGSATWLFQQKRNSGTAYIRRGIQSISGSSTNGPNQDSQTSARTSLVSCFVIKGGRICDAFSIVGTTVPTGVPTVSGTTIYEQLNYTDTVSTGSPLSTQLCIGADVFSGNTLVAEAVIERVIIRTLDIS